MALHEKFSHHDYVLSPSYMNVFPPLFRETTSVWQPHLEQLVTEVMNTRELFMGFPLNPKILPAVLGLQLNGYTTTTSEEGHRIPDPEIGRTTYPYIEIGFSRPWPRYTREEEFWMNFLKSRNLDTQTILKPHMKPKITMEILGEHYFEAQDLYWAWTCTNPAETTEFSEARTQAFRETLKLEQLISSFQNNQSLQKPELTMQLVSVADFALSIHFLNMPNQNLQLLETRQQIMLNFGEFLLARHLTDQGNVLSTII